MAAKFAIIGGGIGGLAAGIALAKAGRGVAIYEQAAALAEIGAGVQLGPNAFHALESLGVLPRLSASFGYPKRLLIRNGRTGARLADYSLQDMRERYGAPLATMHRADLLAALAATAHDLATIEICTGERLESVERLERPLLQFASGRSAECEALVGADGANSAVRASLFGKEPLKPTGEVVDRALVKASAVPAAAADTIALWLFPGGHVVHYPIRAGQMINVVFVHREGSGAARPALGGLAAELVTILAPAIEWQRWPAADHDPAPDWGSAAVTLLGDAAHPSLPYLAQGAAMALEDAVVLGQFLTEPREPAAAFRAYEATRRPRTARITREARRQDWINHLHPPLSSARNLAIRSLPAAVFLNRLDWIYRWRPE